MGSKMQYETKFPMTNQVMLQNLTMALLVSLAGANNQASSNDQDQANNEPAQRVYRWRKRDMAVCDHSFLEEFCEPPSVVKIRKN